MSLKKKWFFLFFFFTSLEKLLDLAGDSVEKWPEVRMKMTEKFVGDAAGEGRQRTSVVGGGSGMRQLTRLVDWAVDWVGLE